MSDKNLLKSINDIDDDLIFEAETWKRPRALKLKVALIAAAAAVLCAATAVTAVANAKPPKAVAVDDEIVDVDYTVYTDNQGREIRTYAFTLPDYALGEEEEGCTPVGQVRVVYDDDWGDGGWKIVDEEGNEFPEHINNKEIKCDIIDPANPHTHFDLGFTCANFLYREYDMYMFYDKDFDGDSAPDKIYVYVFRYDDKETARKLYEKHGDVFDEEHFDFMVELHDQLYS